MVIRLINYIGKYVTGDLLTQITQNGKYHLFYSYQDVFHAGVDDYKKWPYVVIYTKGNYITGIEWP